jgi:hypothetical protein
MSNFHFLSISFFLIIRIISSTELARFTVFFKDSWFSPSKLVISYNYIDFIASCGGILALMLGASLLSFVEIIYFLVFKSKQNSVHFKWDCESEDLVNNTQPQRLFIKSGKIPDNTTNPDNFDKH